jgi:hypothetical protein
LAAFLWWVSVRSLDATAMGDTGYVGILPAAFYVAIAVLTASFCVHLRRAAHPAILLLHVAALIVAVHGIASVVEPVPRLSATWRHVGIAHYLGSHAYSPPLDAYFSWPGFFSLFAAIEPTIGASSMIQLARWFPVAIELAYVAPAVVIFSSLTDDRRLVWLAVWLFVVSDWVGQDYFSPQGTSFLLYLIVVALLLRTFRRVHDPKRKDPWIDRLMASIYADEPVPHAPETSAHIRTASIMVVIATSAAIVASHQLTPFMLLAAVGLLVISGRITTRALALLIAVMCAGWLMFMALPYLRGHLAALLTNVGDLGQNVDAGVVARVAGSPGHVLVAEVRIALTVFLWALAFLGAIKRTVRGSADITCWLLAAAPFAMVALQPYGGEILLRATLFSLPFMAFLAAGSVLPVTETTTLLGRVRSPLAWSRLVVIAIVCVLLAVGTVVAKYGNEIAERFSAGDVDAVSAMYQLGDPEDVLISLSPSVPWKAEHYGWTYDTITSMDAFPELTSRPPSPATAALLVTSILQEHRATAGLVIVTRGQMEYARLLGLAPAGWMEAFADAMARSPSFELVYDNGEASVYRIDST